MSLQLRNGDPQGREAEVVVTDTVPEDSDYEWDSASVDSGNVQVTGVNPYRFTVNTVPPNGEAILQYRVIPRKR